MRAGRVLHGHFNDRLIHFLNRVHRAFDYAGDIRDYVIAAFNSDKPFDELVQEQLAGDILAQRNPDDR